MASDVGMRSMLDFREDVEFVLREQWKRVEEWNDEVGRSSSGLRGKNVRSEENVNLNPLAPPRLKGSAGGSSAALGGIGDRRQMSRGGEERNNEKPRFANVEEITEALKELRGDGLIGLGLGSKGKKSIAEMAQDDISCSTSTSKCPSCPASHVVDVAETSKSQFAHCQPDLSSLDTIRSRANIAGVSSLQNVVLSGACTYASALGTLLARNTTPNSSDDVSPCKTEPMDLVAELSGMRLSVNNMVDEGNNSKPQMHLEIDNHRNFLNLLNEQNHVRQHSHLNMSGAALPSGGTYLIGPSLPDSGGSLPSLDPYADSQNSMFSGYLLGGYHMNPPSPSMLNLGPNLLAAAVELQNHLMDPLYLQSSRTSEYVAAINDPTINRAALGNSHMDMLELQKAYISEMLASQRSQYGVPCFSRAGVSYPGSPFSGQVLPNSPYGPSSTFRHGERNMPFPSGTRSSAGGVMGVWQSDQVSNVGGNSTPSLLDKFKMNKTRFLVLSEIEGYVIEFSYDQYGSRFIQQKLETSTIEEKNMVFHEVFPHALSLMTDVYGNYVVQKFFELGSTSHIKELVRKLSGHVFSLSFQKYGCRVIQKAIEVVDLEQKVTIVSELDNHIMRCVHDQNGNHVIQKCIECVPEGAIQFVVTAFYGQVVTLSTHPYGCRVIQRALEHYHIPETQRRMLNEILQSVSMLAQDQFGNYIVQHILEHGRPDERSLIIDKLSGQIVHLSQQKFASNVVEKCIAFGTPEERWALVNEMLGSTDTNDPLQVLMKDQFANYVVQKVLETCDDGQLELILNRIKVHLNILKKYTYGKHIVARVEKLVAAGERRIGFLSSQPPRMA